MSAAAADTHDLYADGLDSIVSLLDRVSAIAAEQHAAGVERDFARFMTLADERDALTATIVALDSRLAPLRAALGIGATAQAAAVPDLVERHRAARALVDRILARDHQTHTVLRDADGARRTLAQTLETGEHTLAAYRRVISTNRTSALIDARS